MADKIYPLAITPGIQRDGTRFSSRCWIDGRWCRFYRSLPKKMGGYVLVAEVPEIPRGIYVVPSSPIFNLHVGDFKDLHCYSMNSVGEIVEIQPDRTPDPFNVNPYNLWSFDIMYSTNSAASTLIAHVAPNLYSVDSNTNGAVFYGDTYSTNKLVATGIEVSGGIVVLHPYLFMFGNNGEVLISAPNDPTTIINTVRATGQKIVAGFPTRGGTNSPAGLLWSLDSVIRVTFVGPGPEDFNFDTVSSESSILSSRSIIEYDSFYYWIGVDRFLYYDGTVRELPNQTNLSYFFKNLNYSQRQKVWATKITKWGEIWWHYPSINSVDGECDEAVIYNIREKCFYDTSSERGAGYFDQTFAFPIWSSTKNVGGKYAIWMQENGVDQNSGPLVWANIPDESWNEVTAQTWSTWAGNSISAIRSGMKTPVLSWVAYDPNNQRQEIDRWMDIYRIEPDFKQSGPMTLTVGGREYANSEDKVSQVEIFYGEGSVNPLPTQKIDLREQRRQLTLEFESNVVGGDFEMGQVLMVARVGDVRA